MDLEPGIYKIRNLMSGTYLDLAGGDNNDIVCKKEHDRKSQQWEFVKLGAGWLIKNLGKDLYLNTQGPLGIHVPLVASEYAVSWVAEYAKRDGTDACWLHWPKTIFSPDLHWGGKEDGTKVNLYNHDDKICQQYWNLIRCPDRDRESLTQTHASTTVTGTVITTTITTAITTTVATKSKQAEILGDIPKIQEG